MNTRLRILLILLGALVVVATFTFPRWRPFFVSQTAEERFPGLNSDQQTAFVALPTEQQGAFYELMATADATMVVGLVQAAILPDQVVPTEQQAVPQMTDPSVVVSTAFTEIDAIHNGSGKITIFQLPDNTRIMRFEDFHVTNGPGLHVILTRKSEPRTAADVGSDYVDLGPLKGNVGNQNYSVPTEVDFSEYQGIVIYSVPFGVVFSTAEIT